MHRLDIPWEDNYVGTWVGEPSRVLTIRKVGKRRYAVSLTVGGTPVLRPWMNHAPTTEMPATYSYDAFDGPSFIVDLWPPGERLVMHLDYEPLYVLDQDQRDALVLLLGCDESFADHIEGCSEAIGGLEHFVRAIED